MSDAPDRNRPVVTLSTNGRVTLPKMIRDQRRWALGTRLRVEAHPHGVLLREEPFFPPTRVEDVAGSLHYDGPPKTIEEMNVGATPSQRAVITSR